MLPEKISRSFAQNLLRLMAGEILPGSAFGNRRQLDKLEEDRVVGRMVTGRNRSSIRCPDVSALENYLRLHFGITDLEAYLELFDQDACDGEDSLKATTSTKTFRHQSLQGFFIKSFATELRIRDVSLEALPDGVEYFVRDFSALQVPESALVVGVENPECFIKAERLLHLFPQEDLVFVLRYYGKSSVRWLKSIPNNYLHFGDFDPAGIAIYRTEFWSALGDGRCRFFVPEGIETLIQSGDPDLYDRQRHLWPAEDVSQADLAMLLHWIQRYGRGAEQESLLT
ncbi:MAG: hypothetical protein V5783_08455 [Pontiella sp.]